MPRETTKTRSSSSSVLPFVSRTHSKMSTQRVQHPAEGTLWFEGQVIDRTKGSQWQRHADFTDIERECLCIGRDQHWTFAWRIEGRKEVYFDTNASHTSCFRSTLEDGHAVKHKRSSFAHKFLRLSLLAETPTVERTPDGENSGREGNELSAPNPKRKSVSKPA